MLVSAPYSKYSPLAINKHSVLVRSSPIKLSRDMAATRSLSSSRKKKQPLPFYEVPSSQTSAKIMAEARKSVRALPTERPFTPAGDHRILFGHSNSQSRPPSAYSTIGAHHFTDDRLSRPPTGQRLPPIELGDVSANNKVPKNTLLTL